MNELLTTLMTENEFEIKEPENGVRYLYYRGTFLPRTRNKSDEWYEGYIEGFVRHVAMAGRRHSIFDYYDESNVERC